jgi:hypothetical protein
MTQTRDLENSLRDILKNQLRELVTRCVPKGESVDREQIATMLDNMINDWIIARPAMRPTILSDWLGRINSYVDGAKLVGRVKAGKSLTVPSGVLSPASKKAFDPSALIGGRLPFDLLETSLTKLSHRHRLTKVSEVTYGVRSEKIAELLNLSKSQVDAMRKKLRDSGLDVSLLNAKYVEANRKGSGKSVTGTKAPRHN